ncbi:MAG: hypothetical protein LBU77_01140 [Clostridiales bacterium]|jgi:DNA-damage-inducible protein J|nr:hypothetical protein [Clostridiales bacterium]
MEDATTSARTVRKPLDFNTMTEEELNAEIQKGLDDITAGRVISAKEVREKMKRLMGV